MPVLGQAGAPIVIPDTGTNEPQQIPTVAKASQPTVHQSQWPGAVQGIPPHMGPRMPPFPGVMPPHMFGVPPGMIGMPRGFPRPFPPFHRPIGPPPPWMTRGPAPTSASDTAIPPPEECYPDVTDEMIEVHEVKNPIEFDKLLTDTKD